MGLGDLVFRAKRFELKTEHNLGLKNYALRVSASRTLIISKEKKKKKKVPDKGCGMRKCKVFGKKILPDFKERIRIKTKI